MRIGVIVVGMMLANSALADDGATVPAEPTAPVAEEPAPPAIEFVGGDQVEETAPVIDDTATDENEDPNPPTIEDFAVAAGGGSSAPAVTAVVTDDNSGIESVIVFYRSGDEVLFQEAKLGAGEGGLFLGRLPDGLQAIGFAYYVEAKDAAGNVARLGDPERPFKVGAAGESALVALDREAAYVEPGPTVHPAWIALALGAGVITTAAAAVFWVDFVRLQLLLREPLQPTYRAQVESAAIGDVAIAGVASVVALAAVGTGSALLIYSAIEGE